MQETLLVIVLVVTLLLLVTQAVRMEVTGLGLVVALPLLGLLTPQQALSGFSNPALLTVAAMLVMSVGLERAGVVDQIVRWVSRAGVRGTRHLLLLLAVPTVLASAFVNNTPVVAVMIPVSLHLARKIRATPSRVLLPLSYLSILAGTCTLFGTSTNILVDGLFREAGGPGFGVFEFSGLGLCYLAIGATYVFLLAPRLLPSRAGFSDLLAVTGTGHFVTEVVLKPGGRHEGAALGAVFGRGDEVSVLQVVRGEEALLRPEPGFVLAAGDVVYLESSAGALRRLFADPGLEPGTAVADEERVPLHAVLSGEIPMNHAFQDAPEDVSTRSGVDLRLAEAVITPGSRFVGRRVKSLGLSRHHGVHVLAIRRLGRQHHFHLRDLRLRSGDVLLVQGEPAHLRAVHEQGDYLLMEGVERTLTYPERAPLALAILVAVVVLGALGVAPIVVLALGGVCLMLATRVLGPREALQALTPDVVLLLAGVIPLGLALQRVGLAGRAAGWVGALAEGLPLDTALGAMLFVGGLYLLTSVLTEVLSNNAAAVLLTPLALGLAERLGVDARPLLIAVAFGASASFATPIGYQTNTLVMGPGGYGFADYLRFGVPLNLLMAAAAAVLIPWFWPLLPAA